MCSSKGKYIVCATLLLAVLFSAATAQQTWFMYRIPSSLLANSFAPVTTPNNKRGEPLDQPVRPYVLPYALPELRDVWGWKRSPEPALSDSEMDPSELGIKFGKRSQQESESSFSDLSDLGTRFGKRNFAREASSLRSPKIVISVLFALPTKAKTLLLMLNQTHKRNQVRKAASFRRKASSTNAPKAPSFFALVSAVVFQQRLIRFLRPQKAFNEEKQTKKQPPSHQLIRQATISVCNSVT
ncbi:hypothetical protein Ddc_05763 [Ditylenchus destructor]|nr:hypothetical protein Ddc_05763 [Ditylenchus destructor]